MTGAGAGPAGFVGTAVAVLVGAGCALSDASLGEHRVGLVSALARRTHGAYGPCDVPLSLDDASPSIEGRLARPAGSLTLVLRFARALDARTVDADLAAVDAEVSSASATDDELTVELTAVPDDATLRLDVSGLADRDGFPLRGDTSLVVRRLTGDANRDGAVDSAEYGYLHALDGRPVDETLCGADLNTDGRIDLIDVSVASSYGAREDG